MAFQVLVFSKTVDYRHDSIPAGIEGLRRLAADSMSSSVSPAPFTVTASEDAGLFTEAGLAQYRVIVLCQNSGDFLDADQLAALKGFVRGGGGVVGIHCAAFGMPTRDVDTEGWYGRLIGAQFSDHPEPQTGIVRVVDPGHTLVARGSGLKAMKATADATYTWACFDEWYNFTADPRDNGIHVLLAVDETSYQGGKHGSDHPIAWCQEFEGSRSFYTALGHFDAAYADETFMAHVLNGILWTARLID